MSRLLAAGPLGLLLLGLVAGTALGAAQDLSNPVVAPRTAPAGTTISFQVTFTDDHGHAPKAVTLVLNHTAYPMTGTGTDWAAGVVFKTTAKPVAGTYDVVFVSVDSRSYSQKLDAGTLTISGAPTPAPTPTPPPTTAPTPAPTPPPTAPPTPQPTVAPTPKPTVPPTPKPTRAPTPKPVVTPASVATAATVATTSAPAVSPAPAASGSSAVDGTTAQGGTGSGVTPGHSAGASPDAQAQPVAAGNHDDIVGPPSGGVLARGVGTPETQARYYDLFRYPTMTSYELAKALVPTIVTLMTCATAWAAFMLFGGKKRRDADLEMFEDPRLATAASTVYEAPAAAGLRQVDEAMLPRWRRPSLQQVRRTDPNRAEIQEATLSFESLAGTPIAGYERRRIGYRLVRLMDSPDEFRAQEIGLLDHGDEVMLLERYGVYWRVLCPDGREGWIHRMTLADPAPAAGFGPGTQPTEEEPMPQYGFEDDEPYVAVAEAAPEIEEPIYEETAPVASYDGVGDGLLEAYMEARREALRSLEHGAAGAPASPPSDVSGEPHAA